MSDAGSQVEFAPLRQTKSFELLNSAILRQKIMFKMLKF